MLLKHPLLTGALALCASLLAGNASATPNGRIVYYENFAEGTDHTSHYESFSVSPNGQGSVQLTRVPGTAFYPDLSPDGTKLAIWGDNGISIANADGSNLTAVPNLGTYGVPVFSPDGTKLALIGSGNLWVANVDGSGLHQLSSNYYPNGAQHPTWSPDGTKIAVSGYDYQGANYNYGIFVTPADGTASPTRITTYDVDLHYPAWSPDGTKIAVSGTVNSVYGMYMVAPATGTPTLAKDFSDGSGMNNLCWSPDGSQLCGDGSGSDGNGIFIINADGTGRHELPAGAGFVPRWSKANNISGDTITIPGTANVYNADIDTIDLNTAPGTQPVAVDVSTLGGSMAVSFSSITGSVFIDTNSSNGSQGANPPDGGNYFAPEYVAALHGISGYSAPTTGALIGVYLSYNQAQTGQTAPASLDFTSYGIGTDFKTLSPALGQVFFIGDGKASDSSVQKFNVPSGAFILLLGIADGGDGSQTPITAHGFGDNGGSFNATLAFGNADTGGLIPTINSALTYNVPVGAYFSYQLTATNGPATFSSTDLPAGFSVSQAGTVSGYVSTTGKYSFTVTASNTYGSSTPVTLVFSATTASSGTADLVLTGVVSPSGPIEVGSVVYYTFTLTNNGPDTATGIRGSAATAGSQTLLSAAGLYVVANGNTYTFALPDLPSHAKPLTITVPFTVTGAGNLSISAGVTANQSDPSPTNANTFLTSSAVSGAPSAHAPVITSAQGGVLIAGQPVIYTITTDGTVPVDYYTASGLPSGVNVDTDSGAFVGNVAADAAAIEYDVTLYATNSSGTTSATRTFFVQAPPTGSAPNLAVSLTDQKLQLVEGDTGDKYKVKGTLLVNNVGDMKAKKPQVAVYLSTTPTLVTPVVDGDPSVLPLPVTITPTPVLDDVGNPVEVNGVPQFTYKLGLNLAAFGLPTFPITIPKVKPNASFVAKYKFNVPALALQQALAGSFRYVIVIIDPENNFSEVNKNNNIVVLDLNDAIAQ